ncbi:MAG TPA: DUF1223 domain-containing protein [Polyangiales bacterium]|jgi:hypothetical protein
MNFRALALLALLHGCTAAAAEPTSRGFAVVELFTSEGCSSCPPADDVLAKLTHDAQRDRLEVYTLAFHVDYWNSAAWRDRFSATWATERQRAYASALDARGLYTPQMVVNGRDEFIGSREAQARATIANALETPRGLQLQVDMARDRERVQIRYRLSAPPPSAAVLRLALVDDEDTSSIEAGENAGRTVRHVHVVRAFESVALRDREGAASLAVPAELNFAQLERSTVVAYVQDPSTMAIAAAARGALQH